MKFEVDNLQLIHHADILVDGLTVLAAPNGSGKSAISKALALFARFNKDVAREVQYARVERVLRTIAKFFSDQGLEFLYRRRIRNVPTEHLFSILSESLWEDPHKLGYWLNESFGQASDPVNRIGNLYPREFLSEKKYLIGFARLNEAVREELRVSDGQIARDIARNLMDEKFNGDWASREHEKLPTRLKLGDGDTVSLIELMNRHHEKGQNIGVNKYASVFHLEPYHAVDLICPTDWFVDPANVLSLLKNGQEIGKWPKDFPIAKTDVMSRFARISRGKFIDGNGALVYNEQFLDGVVRGLKPQGIASGMKPIAELSRAIEKGAVLPAGLLIIDEPETNLHPEWQVLFADLLVWLCSKCEIKVLVNTHSPYFLRALDVASRREGCSQQSHFYVLDRVEGDYRFETRCVDGGLDEIFAEMHRPFSRLREETLDQEENAHD